MAKARGIEAKLARLHALRTLPVTAELVAELPRALDDAPALKPDLCLDCCLHPAAGAPQDPRR